MQRLPLLAIRVFSVVQSPETFQSVCPSEPRSQQSGQLPAAASRHTHATASHAPASRAPRRRSTGSGARGVLCTEKLATCRVVSKNLHTGGGKACYSEPRHGPTRAGGPSTWEGRAAHGEVQRTVLHAALACGTNPPPRSRRLINGILPDFAIDALGAGFSNPGNHKMRYRETRDITHQKGRAA